jgi:hypothetical protein
VWRLANEADIPILQHFECATPPRRLGGSYRTVLTRRWEHLVQSYFRAAALSDTNGSAAQGARLMLGFIEDLLATCYAHERLADEALAERLRAALDHSGPVRNFKAIAVSMDHRNRGGAVADVAIGHAFSDMLDSEPEDGVLVYARIHPKNAGSKAMAKRNGMRHLPSETSGDPYESWVIILDA